MLTLLLLLSGSFYSIAQNNDKEEAHLLSDRAEWFEGSILLTDGKELKGLVKYNDRNGVLSFQDGTDTKVFTPIKVIAFEFFDEALKLQRIFYAFEYEDSEANVKRPLFFEVLKQYETFAVLSKADRIDISQKSGLYSQNVDPVTGTYQPNTLPTGKSQLVLSQTETIYLMRADGEIKPYFKAVTSEDGQKSFLVAGKDTKVKNKVIDRELLEEFVTPNEYEKLMQYAKENDLSFKKKADFLKIMTYYGGIIQKRP